MGLKELFCLDKEGADKKLQFILNELDSVNELYKFSLEDLCRLYSYGIDEKIASYQKDNSAEYIGLEFIIKLNLDDKFYLITELYFKAREGTILKNVFRTDFFSIDKLNDEGKRELINSKELKFDINF